MTRMKVLAMAAAVAGGLGLASAANAAPLAVTPVDAVAGEAAASNVGYYGRRFGYYRPRPFYRPYGFYGPRRFYGPRFGYYRPRPFYRPYGFYGPRPYFY